MAQFIKSTLNDLENFLKKQHYQTSIQPATEVNPAEQLLVVLGKDPQEGKDLILRLFWSEGDQQAEVAQEESDTLVPQFLQCYILFPFIAVEHAMKDLRTLIFNLNASFDMAFFGLYEAQHLVYYRYVHIHMGSQVDGEAIIAIMATIQFLIEMIISPLADVALGKKTLLEIQEAAQKAAQDQPFDFDLLS